FKTIGLIRTIAQQKIDAIDMQTLLKAQHKIPLGMIAFTGDSTFAMDHLQVSIGEKINQIRQVIPESSTDPTVLFDGFLSLSGNHYSTASDQNLSLIIA